MTHHCGNALPPCLPENVPAPSFLVMPAGVQVARSHFEEDAALTAVEVSLLSLNLQRLAAMPLNDTDVALSWHHGLDSVGLQHCILHSRLVNL